MARIFFDSRLSNDEKREQLIALALAQAVDENEEIEYVIIAQTLQSLNP